MGKKVISAVVAICVIIGLVIAFWKSVFSVKSEHDVRFFLASVCVIIIVMGVSYAVIKKNVIIYVINGLLCVAMLVALIMYKNWNRQGYFLNPDDVEAIVHRNFETGEETNYDDKIEEIIEKYNEVDCIKDWNNLGDVVGYEEMLYIELKDGTKISIEPYGFVNMSKKGSFSRKYKISEELEYFVE